MTSVALPKVAFNKPPMVSVVWYATFSVTSPSSVASGNNAIEPKAKRAPSLPCTKGSTTTNRKSQLSHVLLMSAIEPAFQDKGWSFFCSRNCFAATRYNNFFLHRRFFSRVDGVSWPPRLRSDSVLPASGTWLVSTDRGVRSLILPFLVFRSGVLAAGAHRCGYARCGKGVAGSLSCQLGYASASFTAQRASAVMYAARRLHKCYTLRAALILA